MVWERKRGFGSLGDRVCGEGKTKHKGKTMQVSGVGKKVVFEGRVKVKG